MPAPRKKKPARRYTFNDDRPKSSRRSTTGSKPGKKKPARKRRPRSQVEKPSRGEKAKTPKRARPVRALGSGGVSRRPQTVRGFIERAENSIQQLSGPTRRATEELKRRRARREASGDRLRKFKRRRKRGEKIV
jgi:hypothetical protein